MGLKLQEHQQEAYDNVQKLFENGRFASVVFPTGCGKSFVTLKLMQDNIEKNILFLSPAQAINNQMDNYIIKWLGENVATSDRDRAVRSVVTHFRSMLYQTLLSNSKSTRKIIEKLNPDIIIMDEMHHLKTDNTSEEETEQEENIWGQKVKELLDMYPEAKVLGLTATPERMDGINPVERLFEGNIASEISLVEAMQSDKIHIKPPVYVPADYALGEKLEGILEEIQECQDEDKKKELMDTYEKMRKIVDEADGMSELFQKNITKKDGKYIVFCGSKEDMEAKMEQAKEWFGEIDEEPEIYAVASAYDKEKGKKEGYNEKQIEQFEKSDSNHLKLLYSIDMLNEGLHVDNVSGVIMTRKTGSRLVYLQQLGRALSSDPNRDRPIVFDLVNNYTTYNLYNENREKTEKEGEQEKEHTNRKGTEKGNNNEDNEVEAFEPFKIKGKAQEFLSLLDELENNLTNRIEYNGEQLTLNAIAQKEEITYITLQRNYEKTQDIYEAIRLSKENKRKMIEYNGEQLTLNTIAKREGVDVTSLKRYYAKTQDIYEAIRLSKENKIETIEYNGEQLALGTIAKKEGIGADALRRYYAKTQDIYEAVRLSKENKIEMIEYNGEQLAIRAIAKKEGVDASTLRRYYAKTQDIYEAVKLSKENKIEYNGEQLTINAIAKKEGIGADVLRRYYAKTQDIYEAIRLSKENKIETIEYNGEQLTLNAIAKKEGIPYASLKRNYTKIQDIYEAVRLSEENNIETLEYNGEQLALGTIAKKEEIVAGTLKKYYEQTGDIYEAVRLSKENSKGKRETIEYNGEQLALNAIANGEGIAATTLKKYYAKTRDIYEAVRKCKELQEARANRATAKKKNAETVELEAKVEDLVEKKKGKAYAK